MPLVVGPSPAAGVARVTDRLARLQRLTGSLARGAERAGGAIPAARAVNAGPAHAPANACIVFDERGEARVRVRVSVRAPRGMEGRGQTQDTPGVRACVRVGEHGGQKEVC